MLDSIKVLYFVVLPTKKQFYVSASNREEAVEKIKAYLEKLKVPPFAIEWSIEWMQLERTELIFRK